MCPRDRKEVKTDFFFREKVLFSEIVGKKDRVEQLSNSERSEGRQRSEVRQRNEVLLTGDRGKGNFLKEKKKGLIVRFCPRENTLS